MTRALGGPSNLVDLLRSHAAELSGKRACTFLTDGEVEAEWLSYADLDRRARAIASHLRERGLAGERVLLLFPAGLELIAAFFGCLYAGAVAVPAYPPVSRRGLPQLQAIAADARPAAALTTAVHLPRFQALAAALPGMAGVAWLATDELPDELAESWRQPELSGDSGERLAFLQYTSGSTASPKGVMVTHANLLHNERRIGLAFEQSPESVVVGWLPLYHDMGLIG
ncbi:MAG TPA: AMP-binding protein, partial [Thermoanaerobaculia bacterium]|nr:AMP-binding protein [Thermoanaerobaculia bacterium]